MCRGVLCFLLFLVTGMGCACAAEIKMASRADLVAQGDTYVIVTHRLGEDFNTARKESARIGLLGDTAIKYVLVEKAIVGREMGWFEAAIGFVDRPAARDLCRAFLNDLGGGLMNEPNPDGFCHIQTVRNFVGRAGAPQRAGVAVRALHLAGGPYKAESDLLALWDKGHAALQEGPPASPAGRTDFPPGLEPPPPPAPARATGPAQPAKSNEDEAAKIEALRRRLDRLVEDNEEFLQKIEGDQARLEKRRDEVVNELATMLSGRTPDAVPSDSSPFREELRHRRSECEPITGRILSQLDLSNIEDFFSGRYRFPVSSEEIDQLKGCGAFGDGRSYLILAALDASRKPTQNSEGMIFDTYLTAAKNGEKMGAVAAFFWFSTEMKSDVDKLKIGDRGKNFFDQLERYGLDDGSFRRSVHAEQAARADLRQNCLDYKAAAARDSRSRTAAGQVELRNFLADVVAGCRRVNVEVVP